LKLPVKFFFMENDIRLRLKFIDFKLLVTKYLTFYNDRLVHLKRIYLDLGEW
jgi:hypothetical protein